MHRFEYDEQGNLAHYIDEALRATVAADNVTEYLKGYPGAKKPPKVEKPAA